MIKAIVDCSSGEELYDKMSESELPTQEEIIQFKRNEIIKQLNELDQIVPRLLEDILEQGNFNVHPSKQEVIFEKQLLRKKLNEIK